MTMMSATSALVPTKSNALGLGFTGNLGNIDAYISAVNRLPMLTHDEEISLAKRLREKMTWPPRKSWCCRTCAWWSRLPAAIWAMACRTPT